MLDTNIVSNVLRYPEGKAAARIRKYAKSELCVSVVVVGELRFGAEKVGSARLMEQIEGALDLLDVIAFAPPVDHAYARLRCHLESRGTPISPNDLFIASHALALDLPLITANTREFSRVPDLRLENWLD